MLSEVVTCNCVRNPGGTRNRAQDLPKKGSAFTTSSDHWTEECVSYKMVVKHPDRQKAGSQRWGWGVPQVACAVFRCRSEAPRPRSLSLPGSSRLHGGPGLLSMHAHRDTIPQLQLWEVLAGLVDRAPPCVGQDELVCPVRYAAQQRRRLYMCMLTMFR